MRADKKKNISKVATALLQEPLLDQREIADKTGLWLWTVNRALDEVEQNGTKDVDIIYITEKDKNVVKLWVAEIERRFQNPEEIQAMAMRDIVQATAESTKRYTIFKWDITDKDWGMKDTVTPERAEYLLWLLWKGTKELT